MGLRRRLYPVAGTHATRLSRAIGHRNRSRRAQFTPRSPTAPACGRISQVGSSCKVGTPATATCGLSASKATTSRGPVPATWSRPRRHPDAGRRAARVRPGQAGADRGAADDVGRGAHERLTKVKALAVLSSDALSSVAYATEEILRVLLLAAGLAVLDVSLPIGAAIVALLIIVGISYRQTIKAYPHGGGSYIVAKDNLGEWPALTAGRGAVDGLRPDRRR